MPLEIINGIYQSLLQVLSVSWWFVLPLTFFFIFWDLWVIYVQLEYAKRIPWVLLEIKVPREILKTPKAMEQIFAVVHATYTFGLKFWEKYWEGKLETWMSFELVGYAGGVYFFIRTPANYRNLVESAVYSQYPDAEITEREDYVDLLPSVLPNKMYDLWGTDLILAREDAYPIRTHPFFEETVEEKRLDPLAAVTEAMSRLKEGEMIWLQLLIRPTDDRWKKKAEALIAKLIGKKAPRKPPGLIEWIGLFMTNFLVAFRGEPKWPFAEEAKKEGPVNLVQFMTPGEKDVLQAIEEKVSKLGFESALRFVYIDKRESFTRANVAAVMGAFRQFNTQNLNSFRANPATITITKHPFKGRKLHAKKRRLFDMYRLRMFPRKFSVLNIEELATIYHFPTMFVEAPMLRRVESKKGEPPLTLPVE